MIKPLGPLLAGHPVVSGTSLSVERRGDLVLNPSGLARLAARGPAAAPAELAAEQPRADVRRTRGPGRGRFDQRPQGRRPPPCARWAEVEEVSDGLEALGQAPEPGYGWSSPTWRCPGSTASSSWPSCGGSDSLATIPVVVASTRCDPRDPAAGRSRWGPAVPAQAGRPDARWRAADRPSLARTRRRRLDPEDLRIVEAVMESPLDPGHRRQPDHPQDGRMPPLAGRLPGRPGAPTPSRAGDGRRRSARPDPARPPASRDHRRRGLPPAPGVRSRRRRIPVVISSAMRNRAFAQLHRVPQRRRPDPQAVHARAAQERRRQRARRPGRMVVQAQRTGCAMPEAVGEEHDATLEGSTEVFPLRAVLDFLNNGQAERPADARDGQGPAPVRPGRRAGPGGLLARPSPPTGSAGSCPTSWPTSPRCWR